jgi:hypothetical protein
MQGRATEDTPSGNTARTLILVGLILQSILVLIAFGVGFLLLVVFIGLFFLFAAVLGLIWLLLVYFFSYRPTSEGEYERARTPTIVFAILSLLTLSLISGILYLIAYIKLGDAVREATYVPAGGPYPPPPGGVPYMPPPTAVAAPGMQVCLKCGTVRQGAGAYCSHCGNPWPP